MKKIFFALCISFLFIEKGLAQFAFGVSPGIINNQASFGYKLKRFVPTVAMQVYSGGFMLLEKGQRYDWNTGGMIDYEDKYKLSGTAFAPTLAGKFFLIDEIKLKAYTTLGLTKYFLSVKVEDSNNPTPNNSIANELTKVRVFGGFVGVGAEYFLDNSFSIGGEFGFRSIIVNYKTELEEQTYPNSTTKTTNLNFSFNPTYTRIILNYYFSFERKSNTDEKKE